jgi:hypothetical protein
VIDFRRYRDRMIVAVAVAIAFHEVLLALVHGPASPSETEDNAVATQIVIQAPPSPSPSPRPTPRPTPTPPVTPEPRRTPPPRSTPAAVKQIAGRAKGKPAAHRHGGGAHRAVPRLATTGTYAAPHAAGAGTTAAAGNGNGPQSGTGGQNGNGTGGQGNGNGPVNADTPCGIVEFKPTAAPKYSSDGTASEPVEATVTFPDGHREAARFPYPWIYPNGEQTDPWSNTNLKDPNFVTTLRFPPAGSDTSTYPPLIQYILKHTDSQGYTNLQPCPQSRG